LGAGILDGGRSLDTVDVPTLWTKSETMTESRTPYTVTVTRSMLDDVARYEAMGLTHRQARLLAKLDHLREQGSGCMLLVNPGGPTWAFWRVVPDGLTGE